MFFSEHAATSSIAGLSHDSEWLPVLPPEIIYGILLCLPVKTLLRMRRVSKSWLSLISSPQFVQSHLKRSVKNQEFSLLYTNFTKKTVHTCSLNTIMHGEESPIIELSVFDRQVSSYRYLMIFGSCDGLFCISINAFENIIIWNPSTRELNKLPLSPGDMRAGSLYRTYYGFGYNECQNDYEVIVIARDKEDGGQYGGILNHEANFYSLRTNSWRQKNLEISSATVVGLFDNFGKFLNGRLHWKASKCILSLDLVDETYGNVALPNFDDKFECDWYLGTLGGNLCVFYEYLVHDEPPRMDVWVMKEYGVVESWTRMVSVPFAYGPVPIFIFRNDEFY